MEKNNERPQIDAVVIGNGDYPTHPIPLRILSEAPYTVCCDGGANAYIAHGNLPQLIIGDGDSLNPLYAQQYHHLLHRISEQESNDQTKAIRYLMQQGMKRFAIVAATGRREDHTLGNISLLIDYMRAGAMVRMYTDYGVFIPCCDYCTLTCQPGQQVSIFNFTAQHLHSEGLVYPIRDFTNWWQGTLNECTSHTFTIKATGEYLLMLNYPNP